MGGIKKQKQQEGTAAKYLTRNKAMQKLQLKLGDFRRLCILKGIHPREPRRKFKGPSQTYYHVKDINFLLHEPLLEKFREIRAHDKKVKRYRCRGDHATADRLAERRPTYSLDHLVKERYPSFIDALRDFDDPLSMLHLFATLPADKTYGIPAHMCQTAKRLSHEFQAYVAKTNCLRKMFLSVKGIYFQAEVQGQVITWLVPHSLGQVLPGEVDYRVMLTFLEFYECLAGFVNFKLFHSLGLPYPPPLNSFEEQTAGELIEAMDTLRASSSYSASHEGTENDYQNAPGAARVNMQSLEWKIESIKEQEAVVQDEGTAKSDVTEEQAEAHDDEALEKAIEESAGDTTGEAAVQAAAKDRELCRTLFRGLRFFLGREVPLEPFAFAIRCFGGEVGWEGDGSPFGVDDPGITHKVVDRPNFTREKPMERNYVQPQWIVDSLNFRVLAPVHLYDPGRKPPPHVSPFVDHEEEQYKPDYVRYLEALREGGSAAEAAKEEATRREEEEAKSGQEDGQDDLEREHQQELRAEMQAHDSSEMRSKGKKRKKEKAQHQAGEAERDEEQPQRLDSADEEDEEEAQSMSYLLLPRKKRELYKAMQKGLSKKAARAQKLKARRKSDPTAGA